MWICGDLAHALKRGQLENNAGVYWTKSDRGLSRDEMLQVYAAEFVRAMSLSDFIGTYSTPPEDRTDAFEAALVADRAMLVRPGRARAGRRVEGGGAH